MSSVTVIAPFETPEEREEVSRRLAEIKKDVKAKHAAKKSLPDPHGVASDKK